MEIGWIPIAVGMTIAIATTVIITIARTVLQSFALENAMIKQGVPLVPGKKFMDGHSKVWREVNEAGLREPQDPKRPHYIYPRILKFFYENSKTYGKTHLFWIGRLLTLHTEDPEFLKAIMVTRFDDFEKDDFLVKQVESFLGTNGLTSARGEDWQLHRKIVNPAFHLERLKELVPIMVRTVEEFVANWSKVVEAADSQSAEIEVSQALYEIAADVISRTAFGGTYEKGKMLFAGRAEIAVIAGDIIKKRSMFKLASLNLLPSADNRRLWALEKETERELEKLLDEVRRDSKSNLGTSLLGLMVAARDKLEVGKRFSNADLMGELKTFLFAGKDTTACSLVWTLILLASHEDWQEKAYEEVMNVCGGQPLTYDMLGKLKIVGNIFNEAMRLYPAVIYTSRIALADLKIGDLFIPKGLNILVNTTAMHVDPEQWGPDALDFRPERFANGPSQACKHPQAYAPFAIGPRNCVGQNFAILEAKIVLAVILRGFRLTTSPNYKHQPSWSIVTVPAHDVPIVFSKRV